MKKLLILLLLLVAGCLPNTRKGWHQDEVNKHTIRIQRIDPEIYEVNRRIIPEQMHQMEEKLSFQDRMKARLKAMKGE